MPGLVGLWTSRPADAARRDVEVMVQAMRHEPFYVTGQDEVAELGLYLGWAMLPEAPGAAGMRRSGQGDLAVALAGECFPQGQPSVGGGVPGVLESVLGEYARSGESAIQALNGLFAGCLVDRREGRILLFNDRYGFERIYWHQQGDDLFFASEPVPLLRVLPGTRRWNPEGVRQYLAVGCTLGTQTLFHGISLLPAASIWSLRRGHNRNERVYFRPEEWESQGTLSDEHFQQQFEEVLRGCAPHYCSGRERVGVALTAGLDSRMVLAACPENNLPAVAYTYAGQFATMLDTRLSKRVAGALGIPHESIRIDAGFFDRFDRLVSDTVAVSGGAFGVTGAHEVYFSRLARGLSPVRLTGVCGGEVLRKVSTFKPLGLAGELLPCEWLNQVRQQETVLAATAGHPVSFAAFREVPWSMHGTLAACRSQLLFRTPFLDNQLVALAYRASAAIRSGSESAIRMIRNSCPVLSDIPTDMGLMGTAPKPVALLNRLFAKATFKLDYLSNDGLPSRLVCFDGLIQTSHRKLGVPGLHKFLWYRHWLRSDLATWLRDSLDSDVVRDLPFFDTRFTARMADWHISGRRNLVVEINSVLTLAGVAKRLLNGS